MYRLRHPASVAGRQHTPRILYSLRDSCHPERMVCSFFQAFSVGYADDATIGSLATIPTNMRTQHLSNRSDSSGVTFVFGFGRCVCPGQQLAEQTLWLSCAVSLHSRSQNTSMKIVCHSRPKFSFSHLMTYYQPPFCCIILTNAGNRNFHLRSPPVYYRQNKSFGTLAFSMLNHLWGLYDSDDHCVYF